MKLKPLEDRVIIKAVTGEEKSAGGVFLPDTAKEKPKRASSRSGTAGTRTGQWQPHGREGRRRSHLLEVFGIRDQTRGTAKTSSLR